MAYYLKTYHRKTAVKETGGKLEEEKSWEHEYVSLEGEGETYFFGKYPAEDGGVVGLLIGGAQIKTNKEERQHKLVDRLSKEAGQDLIVVKTYEVTKEQFQAALKNAQDRAEGTTKEGIYVIGIADCIDFVQSVYHAAGLPLHYTMAYSKEELDSFGTLFAQKIMHKYGCRDSANEHFSSVEAVSKEQLAQRLNISVDKIEV